MADWLMLLSSVNIKQSLFSDCSFLSCKYFCCSECGWAVSCLVYITAFRVLQGLCSWVPLAQGQHGPASHAWHQPLPAASQSSSVQALLSGWGVQRSSSSCFPRSTSFSSLLGPESLDKQHRGFCENDAKWDRRRKEKVPYTIYKWRINWLIKIVK